MTGDTRRDRHGKWIMNAIAISGVVFACVFAGALLGLVLRAALPQYHLSADAKDIVKLGMGLIGTKTALLLGLLVASAKNSYDTDPFFTSDALPHDADALLERSGVWGTPPRQGTRGCWLKL